VPLADVADIVWRTTRRKDEGNHFADIDEEGRGSFQGQTLLDLCLDPENVSVTVWNDFYDSLARGEKRGALPFRIWQIYQDMVGFVQAGRVVEFVCAAGILAHYVGDACQPLHASRFHHGRPDHPEDTPVHSTYETTMLDQRAAELLDGVNEKLAGRQATATVAGGHAAAVSVIALMRQTLATLPPLQVIEVFSATSGRGRIRRMWEALGDRTTTCMADGCLALATLWENAWHEGGGNTIDHSDLGPIDPDDLKHLYDDATFLPALRLDEMAASGLFGP
jgi:hypothetical protein